MSWIVNTSTVTGQMSGQVMRRELVPAARAVEFGGLVDFARNVPQAGDEQEHVESQTATRP